MTKTTTKTSNYIVASIMTGILLVGTTSNVTAANEKAIVANYSSEQTVNVSVHDVDGETMKYNFTGEETQVITEIAERADMTRYEVTKMVEFSYPMKSYNAVDTNKDDIAVNVMVLEEGQTLVEVWVNGDYENFWFKTRNVIQAIEMAAEVYRVPSRILEAALIENKYAQPILLQVENNNDDPRVAEREMAATVGYTFYVYQGAGKSSVMVYNNGALSESYTYESDNKSEIVSQLALRYSMTESELELRTTFESDGIDDIDLENTAGRDDNLDPHEGDNREDGNQTPVVGY